MSINRTKSPKSVPLLDLRPSAGRRSGKMAGTTAVARAPPKAGSVFEEPRHPPASGGILSNDSEARFEN